MSCENRTIGSHSTHFKMVRKTVKNVTCKPDLSYNTTFFIRAFFAGSLESAYSLISGSHRIWGQDLGTFMISRPIYQGNDWWKFSIWNQVIFKMMSFCATLLQNDITSHSNVCCDVRASLRRSRPSRYEFFWLVIDLYI